MKTFDIQNETKRYLEKVSYVSGKQLPYEEILKIDAFVKYLKEQNLWGYTVAFLMKSTQNSETNTLCSLGGLTLNNFTLYNNPTWGSSGITFNGTNQYALGKIPYGTGGFEGYFKLRLATSVGCVIMSNENLAGNSWGQYAYRYYPVAPYNYLSTIRVNGSDALQLINRTFSTNDEAQVTYRCLLKNGNASDNLIWANGTELTTVLANSWTSTSKCTTNGDTYIATRFNGTSEYMNGTISFAMHLDTETTNTQRAAIEALINTL